MKMFHVCLSVIDNQQQIKVNASRKFTNNATGFKELYDWIKKHYKQQDIPLRIIMKASVYYEQCAVSTTSCMQIMKVRMPINK